MPVSQEYLESKSGSNETNPIGQQKSFPWTTLALTNCQSMEHSTCICSGLKM